MQLHLGLGMRGNSRLHAVEQAEVVRVACDAGKEFADRKAAFAVPFELPGTAEQLRIASIGVSVSCRQVRLVVERIKVGWGTRHVQEDHSLGTGGMVGAFRYEGIIDGHSCVGLVAEQSGERKPAEAVGERLERLPTGGERCDSVVAEIHGSSLPRPSAG